MFTNLGIKSLFNSNRVFGPGSVVNVVLYNTNIVGKLID
jgi:hypothetical protein